MISERILHSIFNEDLFFSFREHRILSEHSVFDKDLFFLEER